MESVNNGYSVDFKTLYPLITDLFYYYLVDRSKLVMFS